MLGLRGLYPDWQWGRDGVIDYPDGPEGLPALANWGRPEPQPDEAAILAAVERGEQIEQARADLREAERLLDERIAMYNRLRATRASTSEIGEVQDEVTELLDYITEVRNAAANAV
ncbi:hypothetical protein DEIPH_ctg041orf0021 [Deinococcus phoenicis]|uniref:Uncharacterized protein n=2 Tax=Deinococcus phoenicis TaxID=1476583 RepID=A0A016QNG4_9DEIO|nr:hypothetical protein DEIPH_ctg041orf0021 [Deinococcus phoenicis]